MCCGRFNLVFNWRQSSVSVMFAVNKWRRAQPVNREQKCVSKTKMPFYCVLYIWNQSYYELNCQYFLYVKTRRPWCAQTTQESNRPWCAALLAASVTSTSKTTLSTTCRTTQTGNLNETKQLLKFWLQMRTLGYHVWPDRRLN